MTQARLSTKKTRPSTVEVDQQSPKPAARQDGPASRLACDPTLEATVVDDALLPRQKKFAKMGDQTRRPARASHVRPRSIW